MKMSKHDLVVCIVEAVLVVLCLIFEFVPVAPALKVIFLVLTALYSLTGLVYFALRKGYLVTHGGRL